MKPSKPEDWLGVWVPVKKGPWMVYEKVPPSALDHAMETIDAARQVDAPHVREQERLRARKKKAKSREKAKAARQARKRHPSR